MKSNNFLLLICFFVSVLFCYKPFSRVLSKIDARPKQTRQRSQALIKTSINNLVHYGGIAAMIKVVFVWLNSSISIYLLSSPHFYFPPSLTSPLSCSVRTYEIFSGLLSFAFVIQLILMKVQREELEEKWGERGTNIKIWRHKRTSETCCLFMKYLIHKVGCCRRVMVVISTFLPAVFVNIAASCKTNYYILIEWIWRNK